jgi:protein TonB
MTTQGAFYQPKRSSPTALTVVVLLHGAAIAALAMSKIEFNVTKTPTTEIDWIKDAPPPPENLPEPVEQKVQPRVPPVYIPPRQIDPPQEVDMFQSTTIELKPVVIDPDPGPKIEPTPRVEPLPPPPPRKIQAARAKANLASYVSDADYPAAAIRSGDEGTTQFTLSVGPDGRVTGCTVTGSSGSSALDAATCRIMKSRARFQPAKNADGQPTTDTVSNRIRWVLPDE